MSRSSSCVTVVGFVAVQTRSLFMSKPTPMRLRQSPEEFAVHSDSGQANLEEAIWALQWLSRHR